MKKSFAVFDLLNQNLGEFWQDFLIGLGWRMAKPERAALWLINADDPNANMILMTGKTMRQRPERIILYTTQKPGNLNKEVLGAEIIELTVIKPDKLRAFFQ